MTDKDLCTGVITIREGAMRPDLETTPIRTGDLTEMAHLALGTAIMKFRTVALILPEHSDASVETLRTVCEAAEILQNLKARLDFSHPEQTAVERARK